MIKGYKQLGTLAGYTVTAAQIDVDAGPNRYGGAYPGTTQPTGTKLIGHREAASGTSATWNRAIGNVAKNVDLVNSGILCAEGTVPRYINYTWFDPATGLNNVGAGTDIELSAFAAGSLHAPFYLYVGKSLDPYKTLYNATPLVYDDASGRNGHQYPNNIATYVYNTVDVLHSTLAPYYGPVDGLPYRTAALCPIETFAAGSVTFGPGSLTLATSWFSHGVLAGAYLYVTQATNGGWYRVTGFDETGCIAYVSKTVFHKLVADDPGEFAALLAAATALTPDGGWRIESAGGDFCYIAALEATTNTLWVHSWSGEQFWTGLRVNDVSGLVGITLDLSEGGGTPITVDSVEELGGTCILSTGTSTDMIVAYAPHGFMPVGLFSVNGYSAILRMARAFPVGPTDLGMYCAVYEQPGEAIRGAYGEVVGAYPSALLPTRFLEIGAAFNTITERAGGNFDLKVCVTAHPLDVDVPQIRVVGVDGTTEVFSVNEQGEFGFGGGGWIGIFGTAPFDYFRSDENNIQGSISQLQAINQACSVPKLLDIQGLTIGGDTIHLDVTSVEVVTSGSYRIFGAENIAVPGGGAPGDGTWFVFYDVSADALTMTQNPVADMDLPDLAGGANDYPVGGDVLIALASAAGGSFTVVTPAKITRNLDYNFPLTVGSSGLTNFGSISDALTYMFNFETVSGSALPYDIHIVSTTTEVGNITISSTVPATRYIRIYGRGAHDKTGACDILFQPTNAAHSLFILSLDNLTLEFRDVAIEQDFSLVGGVSTVGLISQHTASPTTLAPSVVFSNCTLFGDPSYGIIWCSPAGGGVAYSSNKILIDNCKIPSGFANLVCYTSAGSSHAALIRIQDTEWIADSTGGVSCALLLASASGGTVARLEVKNCVLDNNTNPGWVGFTIADVDVTQILFENNTVTYAGTAIWVENTSVSSANIINNKFTLGTGGLPLADICIELDIPNNVIKNNKFIGHDAGFAIWLNTSAIHTQILDNDLNYSSLTGASDTYAGGIHSTANYCKISNNLLYGEGGSGAVMWNPAIEIASADNCSITLNTIHDWCPSGPSEHEHDGTIDGAGNLSSGTYSFLAADEGKFVNLFSETEAGNTGTFRINSVLAGVATLENPTAGFTAEAGTLVFSMGVPPAICVGAHTPAYGTNITGNTIRAMGIGAAHSRGAGITIGSSCARSTVTANSIAFTACGVFSLRGCNISGNDIELTDESCGILVNSADGATISVNSVYNTDRTGIHVLGAGAGTSINANIVDHAQLSNPTVAAITSGHSSTSIVGNTVTDPGACLYGIYTSAAICAITGNIISSCANLTTNGIRAGGNYSTVSSNVITGTANGVNCIYVAADHSIALGNSMVVDGTNGISSVGAYACIVGNAVPNYNPGVGTSVINLGGNNFVAVGNTLGDKGAFTVGGAGGLPAGAADPALMKVNNGN